MSAVHVVPHDSTTMVVDAPWCQPHHVHVGLINAHLSMSRHTTAAPRWQQALSDTSLAGGPSNNSELSLMNNIVWWKQLANGQQEPLADARSIATVNPRPRARPACGRSKPYGASNAGPAWHAGHMSHRAMLWELAHPILLEAECQLIQTTRIQIVGLPDGGPE